MILWTIIKTFIFCVEAAFIAALINQNRKK